LCSIRLPRLLQEQAVDVHLCSNHLPRWCPWNTIAAGWLIYDMIKFFSEITLFESKLFMYVFCSNLVSCTIGGSIIFLIA
jgi:hypothetical protein